jgi:hypothetical protein
MSETVTVGPETEDQKDFSVHRKMLLHITRRSQLKAHFNQILQSVFKTFRNDRLALCRREHPQDLAFKRLQSVFKSFKNDPLVLCRREHPQDLACKRLVSDLDILIPTKGDPECLPNLLELFQ